MSTMIPRAQKLVSIFWPSFIVSGVGTMALFTAIDPSEIIHPDWFAHLGRVEAYTVGFLFLWALTSSACTLTCYFQKPENKICAEL